jgi:hypothetical protein
LKTIIIDGNNLLHKTNLRDRKTLVEAVRSRISSNVKLKFFFDGVGDFASCDIIFSGKKTADELMRDFIEKSNKPTDLTVISSDNYITSLAKKCSCEIKSSEEFWGELSSPTKGKNINQNFIYNDLEKPERMSKKEIDEFKKYFS